MATESTVILGGGIVGFSTAYFLTQSPSTTPPQSVHIIESSPELFAAASGYAGGFLARDWFDSASAPLGELSFDLHKELAETNNGREKWGYRRSNGVSFATTRPYKRGDGDSRATVAVGKGIKEAIGPRWLARAKDDRVEVVSQDGTTAQVEPLSLCKFLQEQCIERGVKIEHPARAIAASPDMRGELATVRIAYNDGTETDLPCTRLIITAGPWTPRVFSSLFPTSGLRIPISPLAGHSIVVRSPHWSGDPDQECHSVFASEMDGFSPEYIARAGGEIYIAGLNDASLPLPELATDSKPDPSSIARLVDVACHTLGIDKQELETVREGLCFRPVGAQGPIICRVDDSKLGNGMATRGGGSGGVFIGAGHGPWGISQSLGSGKVLAELIEGKQTSVDISGLDL